MERLKADPIVAEVRAVREAHAARFNYDPVAIVKDMQALQATSSHPYVHLPPMLATAPGHCHACGQPKDKGA